MFITPRIPHLLLATVAAGGCSANLAGPMGSCDDGQCDESAGDYYQDETLSFFASGSGGTNNDDRINARCLSPNGCVLTVELDVSVGFGSPYTNLLINSGSETLFSDATPDGTLVYSILPGQGFSIHVSVGTEPQMNSDIQVGGTARLMGAYCLVESTAMSGASIEIPLETEQTSRLSPLGRTSILTGYRDGWFADDPLQFTFASNLDLDLALSPELHGGAENCEPMLTFTSAEGTENGGTVETVLQAGSEVTADITLPAECDSYWNDSASAGLAFEMTDVVQGTCPELTLFASQ